MSYKPPTPPVPDLARAQGQTVPELVEWFVDFFNTQGAPFNYRRAHRATRAAYKGFHRLDLLAASCAAEKTAIGRKANSEVVTLAAPFAFGRRTQVFDLSPRRFAFGRNRFAAYRIPFLFVENGVIYVYCLQPRKAAGPDFDALCMVATIVKYHLLDTEFYGQRCDVEFVDVGVPAGGVLRVPRQYSLATLPLWRPDQLAERLTIIAEALDAVDASDRVERRHRARPRPELEMPLFD